MTTKQMNRLKAKVKAGHRVLANGQVKRNSAWLTRQIELTIKAHSGRNVLFTSIEYDIDPGYGTEGTPNYVPSFPFVKHRGGPARRNPLFGTDYPTGDLRYISTLHLGRVEDITARHDQGLPPLTDREILAKYGKG